MKEAEDTLNALRNLWVSVEGKVMMNPKTRILGLAEMADIYRGVKFYSGFQNKKVRIEKIKLLGEPEVYIPFPLFYIITFLVAVFIQKKAL